MKKQIFPLTVLLFNLLVEIGVAQEPLGKYHYNYKNYDFYLNEYFPSVEAPDAQTELLARTLIDQLLPTLPHNAVIIDVGAGTGLHSVLIAKFSLQNKKAFHLTSLDVIPEAVLTISENVKFNGLELAVKVIQSDFLKEIKDQDQVDLIICNPPIMPAELRELQNIDETKLGNLDYILPFKDAKWSDGLGVLRRIVNEGHPFLKTGGMIALVAPDFIGEQKIEEIFSQAGFTFTVIDQSVRKIRSMGTTWNHMELIEQLSNYHFFDENGTFFQNVASAKTSGAPVCHNIKIYLGIKQMLQ